MKLFFALLRSAIGGGDLTEEERALYAPERLARMAQVAKQHDVLYLLAHGLKQNGLLDGGEVGQRLENEIFKAVYRCEQLRHELGRICEVLEAAEIPFLPLKGSVLRDLYPEAWMRTSCDIDVLVKESDLDAAVSALTDHGFRFEHKDSHDVSLYAPNGTHTELHYTLIEGGLANGAAQVLSAAWETATLQDGTRYRYGMPDEMFYFYHIAHMAKHFENGGCGIRPLIDLWILDHRVPFDGEKRRQLLTDGGLSTFADRAAELSEIWLSGRTHSEVSRRMETYILRGGVYGTNENRVSVQQEKRGGKLRYALSRIFLPYKNLRFHYPILEKHRWLLPLMEVRRWGKLLFCGGFRRSVRELKINQSISVDERENTRRFLQDIGL